MHPTWPRRGWRGLEHASSRQPRWRASGDWRQPGTGSTTLPRLRSPRSPRSPAAQVAQLKLPRRKLEDLYEQIILARARRRSSLSCRHVYSPSALRPDADKRTARRIWHASTLTWCAVSYYCISYPINQEMIELREVETARVMLRSQAMVQMKQARAVPKRSNARHPRARTDTRLPPVRMPLEPPPRAGQSYAPFDRTPVAAVID